MNKPPQKDLFCFALRIFTASPECFRFATKKNIPRNKYLKNTSQKHVPEILSCHFS